MEWEQVKIQKVLGQEQLMAGVIRREHGMAILPCGYCNGQGKGYGGGKCYVCGGKGEVAVEEPIRKCAFCRGRGRGKPGTTTTCPVCKGKGKIHVEEPVQDCPQCHGGGRDRGRTGYPCIKCKGTGVAPATEEEVGEFAPE